MQIDHLTQQIKSTRQELIQHPAFGWVNTLDKARDFMETHELDILCYISSKLREPSIKYGRHKEIYRTTERSYCLL